MSDKAVLAQDQCRGGMEDDEIPVWVQQGCLHPQHRPPMYLHIPRGKRYRHICPHCRMEVVLRSNEVYV